MAVTVSGDDGDEHKSAFRTSGGNLFNQVAPFWGNIVLCIC